MPLTLREGTPGTLIDAANGGRGAASGLGARRLGAYTEPDVFISPSSTGDMTYEDVPGSDFVRPRRQRGSGCPAAALQRPDRGAGDQATRAGHGRCHGAC